MKSTNSLKDICLSFSCLQQISGGVLRKNIEGDGSLTDVPRRLESKLEGNRDLITIPPLRITGKSRQPGCLLLGDPWLSDTASRRLWLCQLSVSDRKARHLLSLTKGCHLS
jgi:hypothetical protein